MTKKEEKKKFPEWFKKQSIELERTESPKVNSLFKFYEKNKYIARVIYMNDSSGYENWKTMLFTEENGDFSFVVFRKKYGISITNKMFTGNKRMVTITYKDGKFWLINNTSRKSIMPLTLMGLSSALPHFGMGKSNTYKIILNKLSERFSWFRYVDEHKVLYNKSVNTIINKKLYSLKKGLKEEYGVPYPVAKILHPLKDRVHIIRNFKFHLKQMDNVESLKEEWLTKDPSLFHDTLRMARILGVKVNCSWSKRRLKEEHDNMSKKITDIIFIDGDRDMSIADNYINFSKFSGYQLLTTTKQMAFEGRRQNHCVASYVGSVECGNSAIYHIKDFTLELGNGYSNGKKAVVMKQFRGYKNQGAPQWLVDEVTTKLVDFNQRELGINITKETVTKINQYIEPVFDGYIGDDEIVQINDEDDLPF